MNQNKKYSKWILKKKCHPRGKWQVDVKKGSDPWEYHLGVWPMEGKRKCKVEVKV